jgi:hypothetical protein
MARRTHDDVLAEMLEKVLAYNISQIIRMRERLSEFQGMRRLSPLLHPPLVLYPEKLASCGAAFPASPLAPKKLDQFNLIT